jgi:U32 family peptidase
MLPLSALGRLRHALAARLAEAVEGPPPRTIHEGVLEALSRDDAARAAAGAPLREPVLHLLCRTMAQVEACLAAGERSLDVEFADIRRHREAIVAARAAGATVRVATPRIHKPGEEGIFRLLLRQEPDAVLVRNVAGLDFFRDQGVAVDADFSLNVANRLSAAFLRGRGTRRIVPSHDLNRDQLAELVVAAGGADLEVVVHQRMPLFHMEHCVFCAVLSPGTDKTNCGRPCDDRVVALRDRVGVEHPLTADVGCRNTLYNATAQSGAEVVPMLLDRGVRHLRVELLDEPAAAVGEIIAAYRDLLAGKCSGREVWTRLRASNRVGVTRGTLEARRDPLAII